MKKEKLESKKFSIGKYKKILIVVGILAIIGGTAYLYQKEIAYDHENEEFGLVNSPVVFVEDDKLVYVTSDNTEPIVIEEDYDIDEHNMLQVAFNEAENNLFAYTNEDELYIYDTNKNTKVEVTSDMEEEVYYGEHFIFSGDGNYLIYKDKYNNVYKYDIKSAEDEELYDGESEDIITLLTSYENKFLFYLTEENYIEEDSWENYGYYEVKNKLYLYDLAEESDYEILGDELEMITLSADKEKILYSAITTHDKLSTYYVYDMKEQTEEKVLINVEYVYYISDDFKEFAYTKPSNKTYNIINNDMNNNTYITEEITGICDWSAYYSGYCTNIQYWNEEEYTYEKKVDKAEMINSLSELNNEPLINVYKYQDGKEEILVENIYSVLSVNLESDIVIYKKFKEDTSLSLRAILEEYSFYTDSISGILNHLEINVKNGSDISQLEFELGTTINEAYSLNGGDIYLLDDAGALYYYKDKKPVKLGSNGWYTGVSDNVVLHFTEPEDSVSGYDIYFYENGEEINLFKDTNYSTSYNLGAYYYHNCISYSCDVATASNPDELIFEDVYNVQKINDTDYYVLKNYSDSNNTADLYKYKDGEYIEICLDVKLDFLSLKIIDHFMIGIGS